jgi:glycosyltransferase involved in cell wall biosynthesis
MARKQSTTQTPSPLRSLLKRVVPYPVRRFLFRLIPRSIRRLLYRGEESKGGILFVGNCYYNNWYLSRDLRKLGWKADTLDLAYNANTSEMYYHGQDFVLQLGGLYDMLAYLRFYIYALLSYDIFVFHNPFQFWLLPVHGPSQFWLQSRSFYRIFKVLPERWDIRLLKCLGKKIVYTASGSCDVVSQTSWRRLTAEDPICDICPKANKPWRCSDERNQAFGRLRNSLIDYAIDISGNRMDYQDDPRVHDVPEFWCMDSQFWQPDLLIPANYRLPFPENVVKIYHAVGNFYSRSDAMKRNIKSTHIYLATIEHLKSEGYDVELIFFHDVPNRKVRYYQAQADIIVDGLVRGCFGATIREGMMLGKPCVCYLRPEWLENFRRENPEYVDELPVISATPSTIYDVLKDLIEHPEKRKEIGHRSREFAVKYHSAEAGARRLDKIFSDLLRGESS